MEKFKFFVTDDIIKEIMSHDEGKRKQKTLHQTDTESTKLKTVQKELEDESLKTMIENKFIGIWIIHL